MNELSMDLKNSIMNNGAVYRQYRDICITKDNWQDAIEKEKQKIYYYQTTAKDEITKRLKKSSSLLTLLIILTIIFSVLFYCVIMAALSYKGLNSIGTTIIATFCILLTLTILCYVSFYKKANKECKTAIEQGTISVNEAEKQLTYMDSEEERIVNIIRGFEVQLPERYWIYGDYIVSIIYNQRADTIKEAINVLEQDIHNVRMQNLAQEQIIQSQNINYHLQVQTYQNAVIDRRLRSMKTDIWLSSLMSGFIARG